MIRWVPVNDDGRPVGGVFEAPDKATAERMAGAKVRSWLSVECGDLDAEVVQKDRRRLEGRRFPES